MFDCGVASGDPTTGSVTIWTRVTGPARRLTWEVGLRSDPATALVRGEAMTDPEADGTARAVVAGLPAGASLWYRWRGPDGTPSPTGATATLPEETTAFTVGVACCADLTAGAFTPYRWLADHDPDLVLHLGDYLYEHGDVTRHGAHDPPRRCTTLSDYRRRYRQYRRQPALNALHEGAPWLTLWDDHEFATDAWKPGRRGRASTRWRRRRRAPGAEGAARIDAAIRANLEWQPRSPEAPTRFLDRHRRIGDLLDLIVVDSRSGRDQPLLPAEGPRLAPAEGHPSLLADEQWTWLAEVLDRPPARWTVVASSVQISPLRLASLPVWRDGRLAWRPLINPDQWDGHAGDRERLLRLLGPRAGSVLLLSGDLHGRFFTSASCDGLDFPELTVPSVTATSFYRLVQRRLPVPRALLGRWLRRMNPHLVELEGTAHGAALLRVTPDGIEVSVGPEAPTRRVLTGRSWPPEEPERPAGSTAQSS